MRFYTTLLALLLATVCNAQTYSLQQLEAIFLDQNYSLIANKFNIDRAQAEIIQEKLWPNPTLSIDQVNLWTNGGSETMSPLLGNYGRTQQIAIDLEQLIETAGKRKKRVAIKTLEHRAAVFEFEELLRELKKELRQTYYHAVTLLRERERLAALVDQFQQLNKQYGRQAEQQNVSRADYYRVQTELVSLQKELVDLDGDIAEALASLRVFTQLPDLAAAHLAVPVDAQQQIKALPLDLRELARDQNIGLKQQLTQIDIASQQLALEKAQRKPDVTLGVGYDRGGNIMQDFIGLGVSIDLPVFNRNKGNIKAAQYQLQQQETTKNALQWSLENAVDRMGKQILSYQQALQSWPIEAAAGQDALLENYKKHLQSGQVTLIEFIDFTQAARNAQKAYLETWENYNNTYEELQYLVGKDF